MKIVNSEHYEALAVGGLDHNLVGANLLVPHEALACRSRFRRRSGGRGALPRLRGQGRETSASAGDRLDRPAPHMGWAHRERDALRERGPAGIVLALALVHHLTFFAELAPWLVVEFVPKEHPKVQQSLATRTGVFPDYT